MKVFNRVESGRRGVIKGCAKIGFVCVADRRAVGCRQRYHGGIVARIDAIELPAFAQGAEAGIAPQDAWDERYSRNTRAISLVSKYE